MDFTWATITQLVAAIGIVVMLVLITTPAPGSPYCMTKAEARAKWPKQHLYWHTEKHCWDNSRSWGKSRRALAQAPVPIPKPVAKKNWRDPLEDCCWPNLDDLKAHLKGEPK